jgi:hypothetical protein
MRGIGSDDITLLTIPTKGTDSDPVAGSIVVVDKPACEQLFRAMKHDHMARWVKAHKDTVLGKPEKVN